PVANQAVATVRVLGAVLAEDGADSGVGLPAAVRSAAICSASVRSACVRRASVGDGRARAADARSAPRSLLASGARAAVGVDGARAAGRDALGGAADEGGAARHRI